jgi:pyrroline-5-carboxylate reductase
MGEAILSRLINQAIYVPEQVLVSDPQQSRCQALQRQYGVQTTFDNQAAAAAEVLLLAIKPQAFEKVVSGLESGRDTLILSILAGVTLSRLEAGFPGQAVIRTMPNTPATVGAGMSAIAPGHLVQPQQIETAKMIFSAIGQVVEVPESAMDAVTGLSGSGPAFVALMVEALADGGVAAGLPRAIALQLAVQTVLGTAQLLQQQNLHPAQLKDQVTSPGGTTIAGVTQLEKRSFRAAVIEAVMAAYQRSQELGS